MNRCLDTTFGETHNVECHCANNRCSGETITKTMKMIEIPKLFLLQFKRFKAVKEVADFGELNPMQAHLVGLADKYGNPNVTVSMHKKEVSSFFVVKE